MDSGQIDLTCRPLSDVSPWLWLGLPLASLAIVLLAPLMGYTAWDNYFMNGGMLIPATQPAQDTMNRWHSKEFGFVEATPLLLLAPAVVLGILLFRARRAMPRHVGTLMLVIGLAAFYFLGEDSSWGQHYVGYKTPQAIYEVNRQHEFNLHNNKGTWKTIFSTVPRTGATVVMIAFSILPFLFARKCRDPHGVKDFWYWFLPTRVMVPTCAMAALATVPAHLMKRLGFHSPTTSYLNMAIDKPSGEFKEYLIALALLLYLASVYARLRSLRRQEQERPEAAV